MNMIIQHNHRSEIVQIWEMCSGLRDASNTPTPNPAASVKIAVVPVLPATCHTHLGVDSGPTCFGCVRSLIKINH